ncbi:MAG TPA: hypothetical protein VKC62_02170 [Gaiellaceae bacterium]|nr:hypothetical protein [Gaiellaceae bacterium]
MYDTARGLTTVAAAGAAGVLLWVATLVGQQTDGRFWAEMGIVAGAGLVMAVSQVIGGWTKGLRLRLSPGTFLLAFVPTLIVVGWILMASQPGHGWYEGTIVSWSTNVGLMGLIHDVALWHGVLAFGFGLVLGLSLDTVPQLVQEPMTAPSPGKAPAMAPGATTEPLTAERREVGTTWGRRGRTTGRGRRREADRAEPTTPTRMD